MDRKILVIGSGGREHAICWKLCQSKYVKTVYVLPGSYAISQVNKVEIVNLNLKNFQETVEFCLAKSVNLVVVGPEDPLANGIADALYKAGVHCFGPEKEAAQIESDKSWAKNFMDKYDIPTAKWSHFADAKKAKEYIKNATHDALVVKASGLAAGKGVVVAKDKNEASEAVDEILSNKKFGNAGEIIVVEELLLGEEVSVLAFTDGKTVKPMLPAQDHKRIRDNDEGPNTGGMGVYCPYPLTDTDLKFIEDNVFQKALAGLQKENLRYCGVLYAGLMLTKNGPKVLEFNCRFGDPETEVILPLLESDLYEIMVACCNGTLNAQNIQWKQDFSSVGVVMASRGYPETSSKGQVITGIDNVAKLPNHIVFHSGTTLNKKHEIVTNGGRVLIAVALAPSLISAAIKATRACSIIKFDGAQYRKDISHKGIARCLIQSGNLSYKQSGVDIVAGDLLVSKIKPLAKTTNRPGLMGSLGGFGGLFDLKAANYKDPILVSGTDGVGTKLKIAQACGIHNTIGIDLVAMCVNDVLAHGAEPLFFLDYFSCGYLDVEVAAEVVSGIAAGCREANCALVGGETAEMPGMYSDGDYDLAGFAVGAVERNQMLPKVSEIQPGDIVIGFPSSGVHSNGFSLVRRVMQISGLTYKDRAPFGNSGKSLGEELLTPTNIYIKTMHPLLNAGYVKAFAHITGGGLLENIPRILPDSIKVELDAGTWNIPPVFGWLAAIGGINEFEMLRTFNCGIGGIIVVKKDDVKAVLTLSDKSEAIVIGEVKKRFEKETQVIVSNFQSRIVQQMTPHIRKVVDLKNSKKMKVGVLISGSGTNLQALIDATQDPTQQIGAEIVLVISNKPNVEGLKRAERANIPTLIVKHTDYPSREEFDKEMDRYLVAAGVELICLAGFMRILSEYFVKKWHGNIINIHPSLLPLFKGVNAQKQALDAGVKVSGCTVHYVEPDIDAGAIIVQKAVPIHPNDTVDDVVERIKIEAEHKAYPEALRLIATGQISLDSNNKILYNIY